ncbi:hypothetical protein [Embleya sp. NPDC059237]|uniref:hypothetical protein n=1 Tax=Embleya sp. NPDC059237 TaxID=3346784 RepID=UPI00368CFB40
MHHIMPGSGGGSGDPPIPASAGLAALLDVPLVLVDGVPDAPGPVTDPCTVPPRVARRVWQLARAMVPGPAGLDSAVVLVTTSGWGADALGRAT